MRQNDQNSLSTRPRPLFSVSVGRMGQAAVCAFLLCLSVGALTPAHAQSDPAAMQEKKSKKKSHKPAPPKPAAMKAAMETARVVVVFPPETKGGVSDQIADAITDVVQARLNLSGKYRTVFFLPSAPTIRRGMLENTLTKEEVDKPVATDARIKKLTGLSGHDMAFVVSIIDYQFDKAANKVSMVLSAKLLDYTGAAPRGTNRNGDSPDKPSPKATEYDLAAALARDLTEKMMSDLMAAPKRMAAETK
jgi:hypothetical protein